MRAHARTYVMVLAIVLAFSRCIIISTAWLCRALIVHTVVLISY